MWPPSRKVSKGFDLVEGGVCPGVVFWWRWVHVI